MRQCSVVPPCCCARRPALPERREKCQFVKELLRVRAEGGLCQGCWDAGNIELTCSLEASWPLCCAGMVMTTEMSPWPMQPSELTICEATHTFSLWNYAAWEASNALTGG